MEINQTKYGFISMVPLILPAVFFLSISLLSYSQETNSHVYGKVKSEQNKELQMAMVVIVHQPTMSSYATQTNANGYFYLYNIKPGGPYTITISHIGFEQLIKSDLFINYTQQNFHSYKQDEIFAEFILKGKNSILDEIIVKGNRKQETRYGSETIINNDKLQSLPSISRNLQDYVRLVPNAKTDGEGKISLAGQNNNYNAYFIDGSNTNDMLGLAINGTAGGQTGSPPISIEAIEEIKVLQSPYDVQFGNFTGGSINVVTKSGTNQFKSSAWYFFRNERMAGKSPLPVEMPGNPGVYERTRLNPFFNQTIGIWTSGPFIKNKIFYFLLAEYQNELHPQPFNFLEYMGNSSQQQLFELADTVLKRYDYDVGTFLDAENKLDARRVVIKFDWNQGIKNKFTLSYRHSNAERITNQIQNGSTELRFSNNRYRLPSIIHSASFEWRSYFRKSANNRFLISYNNEVTERKIMGRAFPVVTINDGPATITFGSNGSGHINKFSSSALSLLNIFRLVKNKHALNAGIDLDFALISDIFLSSYFGNYRFRNMNEFIMNEFPYRFFRTTSQADNRISADADPTSYYKTLRTGAFINDEIQISDRLKITAGVRVDANSLPMKFKSDDYFNRTAFTEIEKFYDLEGAVSGRTMKTAWQLSPRMGFKYTIPEDKLMISGGAGIFSGHILNVWASQIYSVNRAQLIIMPQQYGLRFNPDPLNQPSFQSLGSNPEKSKGTIVLIARNYKYPAVFRTSLSIDKAFLHNWNMKAEIFFTKNIFENNYKNVNIQPASKKSSLPDRRNVYSIDNEPEKIALPGGNPYENIFLLGNNHREKGFSYGLFGVINNSTSKSFQATLSYCFSNSVALFEPAGTGVANDGQWSMLETVNGKNTARRSVSDFSLQHRISAAFTKKINYGKFLTMITFIYNGQSGSPFSYVYNGSIVNDAGRLPSSKADLIYIPTESDLNNMLFISNSDNNIPPSQQKQLLNSYIEKDKYLRKHRGEFAERNGARLPFTHTIDLRFQQDFKIILNKRETTLSIVYDVFNFTNLLNKHWGNIHFLPYDNYALITFAGFSTPDHLIPQYQFKPLSGKPWSMQTSVAPGNSARWISQLGFKINFN